MDVCLRVLKESNKSRFDSYSVRNSVLIISHVTFWDCCVHIFSDNLSRNSCIITLIIMISTFLKSLIGGAREGQMILLKFSGRLLFSNKEA